MNKAIDHLSKDKRLKEVIKQHTIEWGNPEKDVYFSLTRSIVGQQLSVKAAATIFGRFMDLFESGYPSPEDVLKLSIEQLRSVGLSNQKAGYIQNVAQFAIDNDLVSMDWDNLSDSEIITLLTQIKGVGVWTVQMILMFSLQRPDVFPVGDLGIQQAMQKLYNIEEKGKKLFAKMEEVALQWSPYRTLACCYLWRYKDNSPQ